MDWISGAAREPPYGAQNAAAQAGDIEGEKYGHHSYYQAACRRDNPVPS